jgi:hypothetical protein
MSKATETIRKSISSIISRRNQVLGHDTCGGKQGTFPPSGAYQITQGTRGICGGAAQEQTHLDLG